MKLDVSHLRYLSADDFRILTAVEMGSKNHEIVPVSLIESISKLQSSKVHKGLSELSRNRLVSKETQTYDGFRLTYAGYDYLALKTFASRGTVLSVGNKIGVGKESDVYAAAGPNGEPLVLKIHRLGRVSFRAVRKKRDYQGKNAGSTSWMYLSRLAASREDCFLKALFEFNFPVPKPVDSNRHCVVMERIDAIPLCSISQLEDPGKLFSEIMDWFVKLANCGFVHSDYNEFNILVRENQEPVIIDFPQMVLTSHPNAKEAFDHDVECCRLYFERKFNFCAQKVPQFEDIKITNIQRLSKKHLQNLSQIMK